ncbi:amino acid permease [Bacteroides sp. 519]|uniref:amino acid permease n=1 Tax=Bacteroides sp. 519 TaxID=2302937 RepID=UPI0013D6E988|nr:amino acid permease [Bacteroides sp. 519]NDV57160.1 amino acid permease [Bacteroides sp. 519]
MKDNKATNNKSGFGTAAVYFTAISSILGAILFLRLGYASGTLGFWGTIIIILLGHLITIPTALAISELATNTRVEGGGEYFIISRSFGLKLGSTIGITLFLSQTISIAFYTIAFAESFQPLFAWLIERFGFELPRQAISVPTFLVLAYIILKKGTGSGVKLLYIVNALLFIALLFFFLGKPITPTIDATAVVAETDAALSGFKSNFGIHNMKDFFIIFAICFPAFTGMTAGVGLSGDLKNPSKAIPMGTMMATITGLVVYVIVVWKLCTSASAEELIADQLIMSRIALFGVVVIPIGLAACTSSSAIGAMMVAPRTLQAIAADGTFPFKRINQFFARGKGPTREPINASLLSFIIALIFIILGDVNTVAEIITMFFLITYGTLCLSSFLNHFGSPPSYRPRFKSKWFISLAGFLLSVWVMFMINPLYTILAYIVIILIYLFVEHTNKDQKGIVNIFKGALFQLNRHLQIYMQKHQAGMGDEEWRPAAICISTNSFKRDKVLQMMRWISYQHGFGTYFHLIEGYYSKQTHIEAQKDLEKLITTQKEAKGSLYIDTMISPSYTSAIAQVIQSPSISGMENNMVMFEYDKRSSNELNRILENVNLVRAGDFDICIFSGSEHFIHPNNGLHVWIREGDEKNTNFMILLGYIIMAHPDWKKGQIKIFIPSVKTELGTLKEDLARKIADGRLPITLANIEIIIIPEGETISQTICKWSPNAGLTIIGFNEHHIKHDGIDFFTAFDGIGDILFVNSGKEKDIN